MAVTGLSENTILMFGAGEIFPIPDINEAVPTDLDKVVNVENLYAEMKKTKCKSLMVPEKSQVGVLYNLQVKEYY